jgi:hypothetical protein
MRYIILGLLVYSCYRLVYIYDITYGSVCGCPVCSCWVVSVLSCCPAILFLLCWNVFVVPVPVHQDGIITPLSCITQCNRMLKYV